MSHVVQIETRIRDVVALGSACRRIGVAQPVCETVKLFSHQATGHCKRRTESAMLASLKVQRSGG